MLVAGSFVAILSVLQWIMVYSVLEPWWRRDNAVGHSLVLFAGFAIVTPVLFILSLLFNLSRATSQGLAYVEIVLLFSYGPAMAWRSRVWIKTSRRERGQGPAGVAAAGSGGAGDSMPDGG